MLGERSSKRLTPLEGVGGDAGSGGDVKPGVAPSDAAGGRSEADVDADAVDATWSWERVRERFGARPEFQAITLERCAGIALRALLYCI